MRINPSARPSMPAILALGLMALLLGRGVPAHGQKVKRPPIGVAQPFPPPGLQPETPPSSSQFSAIKLEEKSEYRQVINYARDKIKDKDWADAATALQNILDASENFYVQIREKDAHGKETLRWTSVKFEANSLLSTMPDEGLEIYELHSGAKAKDRLDEAKRTGDRNILKEVALTYMYTKAGIEANDLLATYFLDRGDFFMAALRLEKLLAMSEQRAKLSDLTLFKAVLAYSRAGDKKSADKAWARLEPRLREQGGLRVNGDVLAISKLNDILGESATSLLINPNDWPMIHGNVLNSAQATGSQPLLDEADILTIRPTVQDKEEGGGPAGHFAAERLREAISHQRGLSNAAVMSGMFPIAANKLAIYRTYRDLRAVYLYNGKDPLGQDAAVGKIFWQTRDFDGALVPIMENSRYRSLLDEWIRQFGNVPGFRSLLYENSLLGTISTDHRLVYAVDDLAVPAPGNLLPFLWNQPNMTPEMRTLLMQNSLYAVNINTGKYEWRLGVGKSDELFADSHFLGVPISVGGNLWVLNEKNGGINGDAELRLVCIDPNKMSSPGRPTIVGKIEKLGLVQQQHRFTHDISRRTNAVHLAYADGVLVCPTNAGEVLGVDLLTRSLAWAYPYREQPNNVQVGVNPFQPGFPRPFPGQPNPQVTFSPANWKSAPPVIQDGKIVFTAPDANSVHCINLRDGRPVWKKKQVDGDLYMAGVFQGKVLIAGRNSLRALSLADGSQLWSVATGNLPSGQGVASKNIYYMPLQKGEILAVDIERGIVKAHNRAKSTNPDLDPGNLVYYEGTVLSQTPLQLVIYPQLTAKLELVTKQLEADPTNLERLVTRGELLFADGQVQLAVDSLQAALKKTLPADLKTRARSKLYEALTDLLQTDFKTAGTKYVDEYRELCNVPDNADEQQQRLAKFFRIVGQGNEEVGNLVVAFQMYREFGSLPINRKDVVASMDDPMHKVPTNVWLRGRIAGMMAKAKPDQRQPLENKIAQEWKQVKAKKDLDAIRTFVDMFDVPFAVGREARLYLAEAIIERNDRVAFLEAELNLQQLRGSDYFQDISVSAHALAALARLEEKKNSTESMKLAAAYYRELRRDYPKVVLADKKTAAELVDDLTTDPRFLPYLEEPGPLWNKEKIGARELKDFVGGLQGFVFQPEGDLNPLMKQHRLVLDLSTAPNPQLRLYNFGTGTVRWTQSLGAGSGQNNFQYFQYFQYLYQQGQNNSRYLPNARFRFYQVRGNLAVFQVGAVAYCLDMDNARILWQHNLVENLPTQQPGMIIQQVQPDAEGNLEIMVWNQMNGQRSRISIGHVGAVQASYVALVTQKGLTVVDPLRGTVLWKKLDVPVRTRIFGDDQYLFLMEEGEGGAIGAGRAMRAIDGAPVAAADFSGVYQNKVRVMGRKIVAAVPGPNKVTMKLYDIVSGKDLWSKDFHAKSVVLSTEDPSLTGVIEPNGEVTVLDVESGRVLLSAQAVGDQVTVNDIATLQQPLLLQDRDHFYLALNQPVDAAKVSGNVIFNNFGNGLRCRGVNGWLLAFFREDGKHLENGQTVDHKRGDLHWHSYKKLENQMIVLEQFEQLPVILLSARYNEPINGGGGGSRWLSSTKCLLRSNGKLIYNPEVRATAGIGSAYSTFSVDPKERTINLISAGQGNPTVQLYVDDDRKPIQGDGAAPAPGVGKVGDAAPQVGGGPAVPVGNPALRDVIAPPRQIQAIPLPRKK